MPAFAQLALRGLILSRVLSFFLHPFPYCLAPCSLDAVYLPPVNFAAFTNDRPRIVVVAPPEVVCFLSFLNPPLPEHTGKRLIVTNKFSFPVFIFTIFPLLNHVPKKGAIPTKLAFSHLRTKRRLNHVHRGRRESCSVLLAPGNGTFPSVLFLDVLQKMDGTTSLVQPFPHCVPFINRDLRGTVLAGTWRVGVKNIHLRVPLLLSLPRILGGVYVNARVQ